MAAAGRQLEALAAGLAEVGEVAGAGGGADEQDVVGVGAAEHAGAPARAVVGHAAHAEFNGARDHLRQIRVGGEGVGQGAWVGGVGAAKLDRGGRAVAFVVAAVERQRGAQLPAQPERRVYALVGEVAVEVGRRRVEAVDVDHAGVVVARRGAQVQRGGEGDGVGDEQAGGAGAAVEVVGEFFVFFGRDAARGGEAAFLLALAEGGAAAVVAGAERELVAFAVARPLQAAAEGDLVGAGAVEDAGGVGRVVVFVVAVAVECARADLAPVHRGAELVGVAEPVLAGKGELLQAVAGVVGVGEHRVAVGGVHRFGQQAVAGEVGLGVACGQRQAACFALPAEFAEELADLRRRVVAPAVFVHPLGGEEPRQRRRAAAVVEAQAGAPEAAGGGFGGGAGVAAAVLGGEAHRAAEGVEPEQRVGAGRDGEVGDGGLGDQVPVDDVAEAFVHAHAIDKHRQPLRRAEQRRDGEAAVVDVGLVGVVLQVVDVQAGQRALHGVDRVERAVAGQRVALELLDVGGDAVALDAEAGQRRGVYHFNGRQRGAGLAVRAKRRGEQGECEQMGAVRVCGHCGGRISGVRARRARTGDRGGRWSGRTRRALRPSRRARRAARCR